jgi:hypothetical protein
MRVLLAAIIAVFAFPAAAYAQVNSPIGPARIGDYSAIRNVAVISALGDTLCVIDNSGFFGRDHEVDIAAWAMDAQIVAASRDYFAGRFNIVDVPHDRLALAQYPNRGLLRSNQAMEEFLAALPHEGIDAFVVIRPDVPYAARGKEGLSIQAYDDWLEIWANYSVTLYDANTHDVIGQADARFTDRPSEEPYFAGFELGIDLADDLIPTAEQMAALKREYLELVSYSYLETLRALELGITLPAPGARQTVGLADSRYADIETVAVVSTIDPVVKAYDHRMFVGGVESLIDAPHCTVNADFETIMEEYLAPHFTIVEAALDRAAIEAAGTHEGNDIRERFPELPETPAADAYVLLYDFATFPPDRGVLTYTPEGVGLFQAVKGYVNETYAFAHVMILIVDGRTRELISGLMATTSEDFLLPTSLEIGMDNWFSEAEDMTPERERIMREAINTLAADALPDTLYRMGVTGERVNRLPPGWVIPAEWMQ